MVSFFAAIFLATNSTYSWHTYIFMVLVICIPYVGSHKHSGRRGPTHSVKDADGSSIVSEGKHSKRGSAPGYGSHEVLGFNLLPVKHAPYFLCYAHIFCANKF